MSKNTRRNELRKVRKEAGRINTFVADYIRHKNVIMYNEAKQLYDRLSSRYPNKKDVRKTKEYQTWKAYEEMKLTLITPPAPEQVAPPAPEQVAPPAPEQVAPPAPEQVAPPAPGFNDRLRLQIPLIPLNHTAQEQTTAPEQTTTEEVINEGTIQPILEGPLSDELISGLIKELQADPHTREIFCSLQEQDEFDLIGMDIELDEENLLEMELQKL